MWSWHIWVTDFRLDGNVAPVDHYDPTLKQEDRYVTVNSNEAYRFMGVNLGWCDAGILNYDARSGSVLFKQALTGAVRKITVGQTDYTVAISGNQPYYQHGRKDPLLPIVVKDNQIIDKHCYSNDGYAFNASGKGAVPIGQAIQTPHVFYNYNTSNTNDWCNPAGRFPAKVHFLTCGVLIILLRRAAGQSLKRSTIPLPWAIACRHQLQLRGSLIMAVTLRATISDRNLIRLILPRLISRRTTAGYFIAIV